MSSEPAPALVRAPAAAPPALDRVVKTCLAKDPDERWQSTADLERQLQWIAEGRSQSGAGAQLPGTTAVRRTRTLTVVAASGLAGALLAAAALWSWGGSAPVPLPTPARVSVVLPANGPVTIGGSPRRSLALSPDGTQLVYVGTNLEAPADQRGGRDRNCTFVPSARSWFAPFRAPPAPGTLSSRQTGSGLASSRRPASSRKCLWLVGIL